MRKIGNKYLTDNECAYLVYDNTGASGVVILAYWIDEKTAINQRLAKVGRSLVSSTMICGNEAHQMENEAAS